MNPTLIADIGMYIGWTIAYIAFIYIGFKKKKCGMPLIALCLNFSWEVLMVTIRSIEIANSNAIFNTQILHLVSWSIILFLDIFLLIIHFMYGKQYLPDDLKKYHVLITIVILACAMVYHVGMYLYYDMLVSSFTINLVMSVLFVLKLYREKDLSSHSIVAAISRMFGTGILTVIDGYVLGKGFIAYIGTIILFFDIIYLIYYIYLYRIAKRSAPQINNL